MRLSRMSAATRSNRWTRSVSWAMTGARLIAVANMSSLKTNAGYSYFLDYFLDHFLDDFRLGDLTLPFFNGHDAVDTHVRHFVDRSARPTHLNEIHLRTLFESEVQSQIAL